MVLWYETHCYNVKLLALRIKHFITACLVVSAVHFAPYLTGLSSMILIWAAWARCKWRAHLHSKMPWQRLKTMDLLVLGQALYHWAILSPCMILGCKPLWWPNNRADTCWCTDLYNIHRVCYFFNWDSSHCDHLCYAQVRFFIIFDWSRGLI